MSAGHLADDDLPSAAAAAAAGLNFQPNNQIWCVGRAAEMFSILRKKKKERKAAPGGSALFLEFENNTCAD